MLINLANMRIDQTFNTIEHRRSKHNSNPSFGLQFHTLKRPKFSQGQADKRGAIDFFRFLAAFVSPPLTS